MASLTRKREYTMLDLAAMMLIAAVMRDLWPQPVSVKGTPIVDGPPAC